MMNSKLVSALVMLPALVFCSAFGVNGQTTAYSWANKGLLMRSGPTSQSKQLHRISYGEQVQVIDTLPKIMVDTIEKGVYPLVITGNWLKIVYKGATGYAFGAYISRIKPQQPHELFNDALIVKADTATLKAEKWPLLLETATAVNGSVYKWFANGDGCWSRSYLLRGLTFNDALMLLNEENRQSGCKFKLTGIADNTYIFSQCEATIVRTVKVLPDGALYYTEDCD